MLTAETKIAILNQAASDLACLEIKAVQGNVAARIFDALTALARAIGEEGKIELEQAHAKTNGVAHPQGADA